MLQNNAVKIRTAAAAAALIPALLLPAYPYVTVIAFAALVFLLTRKDAAKRLKFIAVMMLPLAAGMWLVHSGVLTAYLSGRKVAPDYGAAAIWLRILAVVCCAQAWMSAVPTEDFIRYIFSSGMSPKIGFLTASPLLLAEQIKERLTQIEEAQLARGVDVHGPFMERTRALLAVLLPLVLGLLSDLPARSMMLDIKGFGLIKKRSSIYRNDDGLSTECHLDGYDGAVHISDTVIAALSGNKTILEIPNFKISRSVIAEVSGGSGSGKSAFAMLLCGAIPEHFSASLSGEILIFGKPPLSTLKCSPFIQYVPQSPILSLSGCTFSVFEEAAFAAENIGIARDAILTRVNEALKITMIEHLSARNPKELSGGEMQKCAIACALAMRPRLLILDEAFSRVHVTDRKLILQNLREWQSRNDASIIILEQQPFPAGIASEPWHIANGSLLPGPPAAAARDIPHYSEHFSETPALLIKDICFAWKNASDCLLKNISAAANRGERIVITGANGAGKSTLLRIIAALLAPKSGDVLLDNISLASLKPQERALKTGFLFQDAERQIFHDTVYAEVAFTLRNFKLSDDEKEKRVMAALAEMGLIGKEKVHPLDLSSSERRLTAVASIAVSDFELLLLDEPTRDLDEEHRNIFEHWLAKQKSTVICISHDPDFSSRAFHKKWLLSEGRLQTDL